MLMRACVYTIRVAEAGTRQEQWQVAKCPLVGLTAPEKAGCWQVRERGGACVSDPNGVV